MLHKVPNLIFHLRHGLSSISKVPLNLTCDLRSYLLSVSKVSIEFEFLSGLSLSY